MGKKKMICPRIFLPYEILPLLERKSSIYCTFYYEKEVFKNFMYWILGQIIFFFPTKDSIGMLVMDFEGIFEITFFSFNLNPALCDHVLFTFDKFESECKEWKEVQVCLGSKERQVWKELKERHVRKDR